MRRCRICGKPIAFVRKEPTGWWPVEPDAVMASDVDLKDKLIDPAGRVRTAEAILNDTEGEDIECRVPHFANCENYKKEKPNGRKKSSTIDSGKRIARGSRIEPQQGDFNFPPGVKFSNRDEE